MKKNTTVRGKWIAERLELGHLQLASERSETSASVENRGRGMPSGLRNSNCCFPLVRALVQLVLAGAVRVFIFSPSPAFSGFAPSLGNGCLALLVFRMPVCIANRGDGQGQGLSQGPIPKINRFADLGIHKTKNSLRKRLKTTAIQAEYSPIPSPASLPAMIPSPLSFLHSDAALHPKSAVKPPQPCALSLLDD